MEKIAKIIKGKPLKDLPVPGETLPAIFLKQKNKYGANRVAIRTKVNDLQLKMTYLKSDRPSFFQCPAYMKRFILQSQNQLLHHPFLNVFYLIGL